MNGFLSSRAKISSSSIRAFKAAKRRLGDNGTAHAPKHVYSKGMDDAISSIAQDGLLDASADIPHDDEDEEDYYFDE